MFDPVGVCPFGECMGQREEDASLDIGTQRSAFQCLLLTKKPVA